MIVNGDFSQNSPVKEYGVYMVLTEGLVDDIRSSGGWHLIVDETAEAKAEISEKQAAVTIGEGGRIWYSIQFCFLPFEIEKNSSYRISFRAKADSPRDIILEVCHVGDDWYSFTGRKYVRLTEKWKTYEYSFTAGADEPNARFEFNLGDGDAGAYFDNVRLWKEQ